MYPLPTADPILEAAASWAHCVSVTGMSKQSYCYMFPFSMGSSIWMDIFFSFSSEDKSRGGVHQFHTHASSLLLRVRFHGLFEIN